MLQQDTPDDYVVATGETRTVREFIQAAFDAAGIEIEFHGKGRDEYAIRKDSGETVVKVNPKFSARQKLSYCWEIRKKAETNLGWKREISFAMLVERMVKNDLLRVEKEQ